MKNKIIGILIMTLLVATAVLPVAGSMDNRSNQKVNDAGLIPDLVYSPSSHDFGNVGQGQTYQTTFQIWNGGSGTMTFNLGIVHTWISPNPTGGKSDGSWDKVTITVTIDTTGLPLGSHSGFVSITADDGGGVRYFNIDCNVVTNNPPNTPSKPSGPTSVTEGVTYDYTISTTDPDGDNVKYGLDFDNDGVVDPGHWTGFYPQGAPVTVKLTFYGVGTRYMKAIAEDIHGAQSVFSSALTIVVSGANNPPNTPSTPSGPASGNTGASYSYSTSTTDSDGDDVKYGWDWNGDGNVDEWSGFYSSGLPCSLLHSWSSFGSYQVKVKVQDEHGAESGWSSALTVIISAGNDAPNKPDTPSGQTNGKTGTSYTYSTSTEDLDGDQVWYKWDWGDEVSNWDGPYNSGDLVYTSHVWSNQGTYAVKVKAKDTSDAESVWSDPLSISMPKNKLYMPFGTIFAFGFDVDVKIIQLEPGEDYVDLEVLSKPFYIWENEMHTINPGAFIRLTFAKGFFSPSVPICFGICEDWGIIG